MSEYSSRAVVDFLQYAANKGLLNKATANAKRIAVERVFEAAEPNEAQDVREVDVESLMHRFMNLSGSGFKPGSLTSYQSRVRSSIEEFLAWKSNPMTFRPARRGAAKKGRLQGKAEPANLQDLWRSEHGARSGALGLTRASLTLPVPIRGDLTVQIQGIPFDLTKSEATKIANVVLAMATES